MEIRMDYLRYTLNLYKKTRTVKKSFMNLPRLNQSQYKTSLLESSIGKIDDYEK